MIADSSSSGLGRGDAAEASKDGAVGLMMTGLDSLYQQEVESRLQKAHRQGRAAAELKKSGEISVLQSELGSKSRCVRMYVM